MTMCYIIIFAATTLKVVAENADEFFRLPDVCPKIVPQECMFVGNPTNELLRFVPGSVSALYAAYTGQWERERITNGISFGIDHISGLDPDGSGQIIRRPLSFWLEHGDLRETDPVLDMSFGNYSLPSNRTIETRRLVGWSDLPDAIKSLRRSLSSCNGLDLMYSDLLPRKKLYSSKWAGSIEEVLGLGQDENIRDVCWPQFMTLSNDFFVTHYDHTNSILDEVIGDLLFYYNGTNSINRIPRRSQYSFMSEISKSIPTNYIHQLTNETSRLLYWRQAAYNLAVSSINVVYDHCTELPTSGEGSDIGFIWDALSTKWRFSTQIGGKASYSVRTGLILEDPDIQHDEDGMISTNYFFRGFRGDYESSLVYDSTGGRSWVVLDGETYLSPADFTGIALLDGRVYNVYYAVEDLGDVSHHVYRLIFDVYDVTESAPVTPIGTFYRDIPELYEGNYYYRFDGYYDDKDLLVPEENPYTLGRLYGRMWQFDAGYILRSDVLFAESCAWYTNGVYVGAIPGVGVTKNDIHPGVFSNIVVKSFIDDQKLLRNQCRQRLDQFRPKKTDTYISEAINAIRKGFTFIIGSGTLGVKTIKKVDGKLYYWDPTGGEFAPFDSEMLVGGIQVECTDDISTIIPPDANVKGRGRAFFTHKMKYKNMNVEETP